MSLLLGDMLVRYKADITDLTVKTAEAAGDVDGFASGAKVAGMAVAGALIATGVAAVGLGIASTKMAADFQTAMISNVAHAGLAKSQFDSVSQSVLAMSSAVGRSPTQLAEALYPILSAFSGIQNQSAKSAIALDTLRMSFQTVAGTTVDGTAVANAAVGTFNALGLATNNVGENTKRMTNLFDVMDKTVQLGNMQWDQYKNVVAKVAIATQGTTISFNESQAALATMTNESFSARQAGTYLVNTFNTLAIKTDALEAHAKKLKISFDENKYASMDFAGKIEYLNQVTDGNKQKLLALMGNNSTALRTFNALSVGIDSYRSNLNALNHAQGTLAGSFEEASKGFGFQMQQMKAAGDALLVTIGTQLLPVASQLMGAITPLVGEFTKWLTSSGFLQSAAKGLSGTISQLGKFFSQLDFGEIIGDFKVLAGQINSMLVPALQLIGPLLGSLGPIITTILLPGIDDLIVAFSSVIGWFQQASPVAVTVGVALLAIAGGFAAIQIGAFIAAVPAIVGGFIAWAVAAWTAAAGTIAATWPLFAIGAAVVIVVALIVLAVRNWGAIAHWLQGVWAAVIGWLGGALNAIGGFFVAVWNGIKAGTKAAWDWIVNALKVAGRALLDAILAPFIAIGALFQWLYNHNTYIKQLVDAIVNFFKAGFKWMQDAWTNTVTWLTGLWNTILSDVKAAWKKVSDVFAGIWNNYIAGPLGALWNAITGWLGGVVRDTLHGWEILWQKVSTLFMGIWNNYVSKPLSNLWTSISKWFADLGKGALDSGKNFISMLVQGISSGAGAVWDAVKGVASNIWSALGFHSPTESGPGKDADKWMPNLIKMLVSGLNTGAPQVKAASQNVAAQIIPYPIKPSAVAVAAASQQVQQSSGQGQTFILEVDGHKLAEITNKHTDRTVRLKLGDRGRAA